MEGWAHSRFSTSIFRPDNNRAGPGVSLAGLITLMGIWETLPECQCTKSWNTKIETQTQLSMSFWLWGYGCIGHANSSAGAIRGKHRVSGPPAQEERGVWRTSSASAAPAVSRKQMKQRGYRAGPRGAELLRGWQALWLFKRADCWMLFVAQSKRILQSSLRETHSYLLLSSLLAHFLSEK